MPRARRCLLLAVALLLASDARADHVEDQVRARLTDSASLLARLTRWTEEIGPRLTGSEALERAHRDAKSEMERLGLRASLEGFHLEATWSRGPAFARLVRPTDHVLQVAQVAWSPPTEGTAEGPVVRFAPPTPEAMAAFHGQLKGAVVLLGEPAKDLEPLAMALPLRLQRPKSKPEPRDPRRPSWGERIAFLVREGALAGLRDSGKPDGLFDMDHDHRLDRERGTFGDQPTLPAAFAIHEQYLTLWHLAERGAVVSLRLEGSLGPAAEAFNTVADLPGTEKPEEVVVLAAHLDSFDLGTGATDDGAGAAAVVEAAALLAKAGARPRRTIRFVLFSGEEEGFLGSRAYVDQHRAELARHSAIFVIDTGTGRIDGVALQGRAEVEPVMRDVLAPLRALGVVENDLRLEDGADHIPFHEAGVPAFCVEQVQHDYSRVHHSESDTLDKVRPDELQQASVVLALVAYRVAQRPDLLPRPRP